jgi:hypothetical protein
MLKRPSECVEYEQTERTAAGVAEADPEAMPDREVTAASPRSKDGLSVDPFEQVRAGGLIYTIAARGLPEVAFNVGESAKVCAEKVFDGDRPVAGDLEDMSWLPAGLRARRIGDAEC